MLFSCYSTSCSLWNFGFGLGLNLLVQLITGLLLSCRYNSSNPYIGLDAGNRDVHIFWLISLTHSIGTSTYFLFIYLHMIRALISTGPSRSMLSGLLLFLASIVVALMGYTLCYGNMAIWALTVVTSLVQLLPGGSTIITLILGNHNVSLIIIPRALTMHFFGGLLLWLLTIIHIMEVHKVESTSDISIRPIGASQPFIISGASKDLLMIILLYLLIVGSIEDRSPIRVLMEDPHAMDAPQPFKTPDPIGPEWYILSMYCGLKLVPILWLVPIIILWTLFLSDGRGKQIINAVAYTILGIIALKAHVVMYTSTAYGAFLILCALKGTAL